jgi:enoyl-CoA hydratase/carnithine racemase
MAGIIHRTGAPDKGECVMAAITFERHEAVAFYQLKDTEDLAEGTRAFAEKRPPVFRGR